MKMRALYMTEMPISKGIESSSVGLYREIKDF